MMSDTSLFYVYMLSKNVGLDKLRMKIANLVELFQYRLKVVPLLLNMQSLVTVVSYCKVGGNWYAGAGECKPQPD